MSNELQASENIRASGLSQPHSKDQMQTSGRSGNWSRAGSAYCFAKFDTKPIFTPDAESVRSAVSASMNRSILANSSCKSAVKRRTSPELTSNRLPMSSPEMSRVIAISITERGLLVRFAKAKNGCLLRRMSHRVPKTSKRTASIRKMDTSFTIPSRRDHQRGLSYLPLAGFKGRAPLPCCRSIVVRLC